VVTPWYYLIMVKTNHSRTTSLRNNTCNNIDFIIFYLNNHSASERNRIERALHCWRPTTKRVTFASYFSAQYGFISKSYGDTRSAIRNPGYKAGTNKTTYWWQPARGIYALNKNGRARLLRIACS